MCRSNGSTPDTNTSARCGTTSFHCVRSPTVASVASTTRKFFACQFVRMTQRPPACSASYSKSRSRGTRIVKVAVGWSAGMQRISLETVLLTLMHRNRSSFDRPTPM